MGNRQPCSKKPAAISNTRRGITSQRPPHQQRARAPHSRPQGRRRATSGLLGLLPPRPEQSRISKGRRGTTKPPRREAEPAKPAATPTKVLRCRSRYPKRGVWAGTSARHHFLRHVLPCPRCLPPPLQVPRLMFTRSVSMHGRACFVLCSAAVWPEPISTTVAGSGPRAVQRKKRAIVG